MLQVVAYCKFLPRQLKRVNVYSRVHVMLRSIGVEDGCGLVFSRGFVPITGIPHPIHSVYERNNKWHNFWLLTCLMLQLGKRHRAPGNVAQLAHTLH